MEVWIKGTNVINLAVPFPLHPKKGFSLCSIESVGTF